MPPAKRLLPQRVTLQTLTGGAVLLSSPHDCDPVAETCLDWLDHWAETTPNHVFLAERRGGGWREVGYATARGHVRGLAAGLLAAGLKPGDRLAILSGNSVNHGLLALAAMHLGVAVVPVAEQYALIPEAHDRLQYIVETTDPALIYAERAAPVAPALALPELAGRPFLSAQPGESRGIADFDALMNTAPTPAADAARAAIGPDTLAKILFTSGSTDRPKGVTTSQRMMCVNMAQIGTVLPFLKDRPPRIVDWLPWNHVFGGSHNFNMMLAFGGALYIDHGKPAPGLFDATLENLSDHCGTLAFNVPVGWALIAEALEKDEGLCRRFLGDLDLIFYAGAPLPQDLWQRLRDLAVDRLGHVPLMISSWGMTETAPAALIVHEPLDHPGAIGVPLPGVEAKLLPLAEGRYELRVRGANVTRGYYRNDEKTAKAFDDEGYLITGDAVRFLDPARPEAGLIFDGRLGEDFKLMSGTWVQSAKLRADALRALGPLAQDVVVTGQGETSIGLLIFPGPALREPGAGAINGALTDQGALEKVRAALAPLVAAATGSASRIARALVLAGPPSLKAHEVTAKGNLNISRVLAARKTLVARLHRAGEDDPAVIRLTESD